jgi:small-conductance mechanosensitive channel
MKRLCIIIFIQFFALAFQPAYAQNTTEPKGEPVIIKNDTLFKFYTAQGLFTVRERARIVTKRIQELVDRLDFNPDSLRVKNDSSISIIFYQSQIILSVSNKDASFSELNRPELAASYLVILKKKLGDVFTNNNAEQTTINILEALAIIVLLIILIWGVDRAFIWIRLKTEVGWKNRMDKLAQQGAPVSYANKLLPVINSLLAVLRLLIIAILIYLSLPVLFLIFPASKPIATLLFSYILNPLKAIFEALLHFIPNVLTILVIFMVTRYIVKLVKFAAIEIKNDNFRIKGFYADWAMPTYNIIRVLLYAFMFIVIFPYLPGSDSKVFQGVTVFLGLLFSLGSSSAISSIVAGLVLTYMRPFKVGDVIKVGDTFGAVTEKNLLVTRIRTIKNEDITLPNATILSGHTINYTSSSTTLGLILHTSVTIGYDSPWRVVHQLLISAAESTTDIISDPKPFVLQTDLNDFYVTYQINAYTRAPLKIGKTYSSLHQNIQDKFNEAGVEIMSPHYTSLRDGNHIAIPDDYITKDYKSPGFNINKEG